MKMLKRLSLVVMVILVIGGCTKLFIQPETGETLTPQQKQTLPVEEQKQFEPVYVIPETVAKTIDKVVKASETVVPIVEATVGTFWPIATPILEILGSLVVGAGIAWRTMRGSLTKAQTKTKQLNGVATAVVLAIKKWRESESEDWKGLEEQLFKMVGPTAENIIRGIRGLPPKE